MSVRAITRVFDGSHHGGTELLMLVVLADYSDDNGNSYPSVAALARKCRMSVRNANYILSGLQASGELQVLKCQGPNGTNRYRLVFAKMDAQPLKPIAPPEADCTPAMGCTPEAAFTLKPASGGGEAGFPNPLKPIAPKPSLNRQEPSDNAPRKRLPKNSGTNVELPGVDPALVHDWLQVRKAKRVGPVTSTVVKGLVAEAEKAGLTLQQVVELCCQSGWASFKADWDRGGRRAGGRADPMAPEDKFAGAL